MTDKHSLQKFLINQSDYPSEDDVLGVCEIKLRVNSQPRSSLNLSFGAGRMNQTGRYQSRPWFEVELSASVNEIKSEFYPKSEFISPNRKTKKGRFISYIKYQHNYYRLEMKVHADNGKNISSVSGGREALGQIIKGKLVNSNSLKPGELITSETLMNYGRDIVELHKLSDDSYVLKF